jgi:hypothetical protein
MNAARAYDVPTGSFGRTEYRLPEHITPTTPEEQARHLADLDAALSTIRVGDALRRHPTRKERTPVYQNATRADIVASLRTGLSDAAIARRLHCDKQRVGKIRRGLGLPSLPQQRLTLEEKWRASTRALDGGHLEWTGERGRSSGTPIMRYKERYYSPAAVAFQIKHGHAAVGYAIADCGLRHCVAPDHVEDEAGRQRIREQLRYLQGGGERKPFCNHGHDQADHGRYQPDGTAYCEACKAESKQAKREAAV